MNSFFLNYFYLFQVWTLCLECFPIEYPQCWYEEITSNPKFYSLAALHEGRIIGLIVAEIKEYVKLCHEVRQNL